MSNIWATRISHQPVMVSGEGPEWLQQHLNGAAVASAQLDQRLAGDEPVMQDDFWPSSDSWLSAYRPYNVQGGTLFIPIKGMLVHDYGYAVGDWLTGYTYIAKAFERGMGDDEVDRIAMVVSSGGGMVSGNFDLVDKIFAMRGQKPIQAFVNESAYSAAYSLASAADEISMTRTAGVGSIGVVMAHVDLSGMMNEAGVKVTFIHAGDHKVDGNPYEPLSDDVKNRMQVRIDSVYDIFVSTVARNRGLDESAVRDTQALTYGASDAISVGLADEVLPFEDAVAAFSGALNDDPDDDPDQNPGDQSMTKPTSSSPVEQETNASQDQLDAARAEGRTEGATAERTRIQSILNCEAAANRGAVASHLALNTNMPAEEAISILQVTPEQAKAPASEPDSLKAGSQFEQAMANNNPGIKPGSDEGTQEQANADDTLAQFRQVNGIKK